MSDQNKCRLINTYGRNNKFWECTLEDKTFTVHFGGIGKKFSQKRSRTFPSRQEAEEHMRNTIAKKIKDDYEKEELFEE